MKWRKGVRWLAHQLIGMAVLGFLVCGMAISYLLLRSDERR